MTPNMRGEVTRVEGYAGELLLAVAELDPRNRKYRITQVGRPDLHPTPPGTAATFRNPTELRKSFRYWGADRVVTVRQFPPKPPFTHDH